MPLAVSTRKSRTQTSALAIDPLAEWMLADPPPAPDGRRFAMIELKPGIDVAALRRGSVPDDGTGSDPVLFTVAANPVHRSAWQTHLAITRFLYPDGYGGRFVTALVSPELLEWLANVPAVQALIAGLVLCVPPGPLTDETPAAPPAPAMAMLAAEHADDGRGRPVIMAVIDHRIPLAHPALTGRAGALPLSRLQYCWFQDGADRPGATQTCPYGSEVSDDSPLGPGPVRTLTQALRLAGSDERLVRRSLDVAVPLRRSLLAQGRLAARRASHGAAVLGLAAGEKQAHAGRADRPIIAVDLPEAAVMDPSGASLAGHILDALVYITRRARELKQPGGMQMPVVVTLSYGNNAGPHDGSWMIERAIADVVDRWNGEVAHAAAPLAVVISAGNAFQARGHARWMAADIGSEAASQASAINWRIPPDDNSPNIVHFWLPPGFAGQLDLAVTPPTGEEFVFHASPSGDDLAEWTADDGSVVAQAIFCPATPAGHRRALLQLIVGPTTRTISTGRNRAPAGQWRIRLRTADLGPDAAIDACIQSDDRPVLTGRPFRQSDFVDTRYTRFAPPRQPGDGTGDAGPIRRAGAMNAMATGSATLVVGAGHRPREGAGPPRAALYSGGGQNAAGGVDLLALTDASLQHPGRMVPGMTAGKHVWMFGTSLAAPVAARWVADNIAAFEGRDVRLAAHLLLAPGGGPVDPRTGAGAIPAGHVTV